MIEIDPRLEAAKEAIKILMETQFPDMEYFAGLSVDDKPDIYFLGNSCPVCFATKLVTWIKVEGVQHNLSLEDSKGAMN